MSYPTPQSRTATIAAGSSLSGSVGLGDEGLLAIYMPGWWDTANLTFQVSYDNVTYYNMYDQLGNELQVPAAASWGIALLPYEFAGFRFLKVRSGTAGVPVDCASARDLTLITRVF